MPDIVDAGQRRWVRHHPYADGTLGVDAAQTARVDVDDARIVDRLVSAYRRAAQRDYTGEDSMWRGFQDQQKGDLHQLLLEGGQREIAEALRSPRDNFLLHGFETLTRDTAARFDGSPDLRAGRAERLHDMLVRLAEALGVLRVENPEGGAWLENLRGSPDEVLDAVEAKLGIALEVPWFWAGLVGLRTRRGVFNHRMIHAAYVVWRIRQLVDDVPRPRILEIGAGVGHLARYAWLMGLRDYTIVDLPLTNVAQGYFLMRCLGEDAVVLEGEPMPADGRAIRVVTPSLIEAPGVRYDLVVNVDSMTEVGKAVASDYVEKIFSSCRQFFSINHEANPFTVNELLRGRVVDRRIERFPCWTRRGYVEEIVRRI